MKALLAVATITGALWAGCGEDEPTVDPETRIQAEFDRCVEGVAESDIDTYNRCVDVSNAAREKAGLASE